MNDLHGYENLGFSTNATTNVSPSDSVSIKVMIKLMNQFRRTHPPDSNIVRVEMPRRVWRELAKIGQVAPHPVTAWPQTITGVPIQINDAIPENCYTLEYADGHVDMVTPTGQFRLKEPSPSRYQQVTSNPAESPSKNLEF